MGIYISGIDMPTKGNPINVLIYPDGTAEWSARNKTGTAIPVLAHGRLIDADALCAKHYGRYGVIDEVAREAIKAAPIVIPAEQEEQNERISN